MGQGTRAHKTAGNRAYLLCGRLFSYSEYTLSVAVGPVH